jgi:hypothetical protein
MDDREFSSPVCYLDYDGKLPVTSEPALCKRCKGVVAGFDLVCDGMVGRDYDEVKIFESTIGLSAISKPICFLCSRFFKNVADFPQEMSKLNTGASVTVDYFYRISSGDKFIIVYFRGNPTPLSSLKILDHASGKHYLSCYHLCH